MNTLELASKVAAATAAAELISDGMIVGLGTGSTTQQFIARLIERVQNHGLKIRAVATSQTSVEQAKAGGIPIIDINTVVGLIDLTVDGADQIDKQKRMIKGGGGALVREKITASTSKEMVVIVDSKKVVERLGSFPLPVEIIAFGYQKTIEKLEKHGYRGILRLNQPQGLSSEQNLYRTENGNYIFDIHFKQPLTEPERHHNFLKEIPGVVETGFFFGIAGRVIIGYPDGHTEEWK